MTPHVETTLRDTLRAEADTVTVADDPWPRFTQREKVHRRARRFRAGVIAAILAAAVGIQTNLIPLPGWVPGIAVASSPSPLADGPTRGALAADHTWLNGLRRQVTDLHDPQGWWRVTDRDAIRIVYADDIPGRRIALVFVPLRLGVITSSTLIWFSGPPGAEPDQMEQGGNDTADTRVITWMESDPNNGGAAVVIGPAGSTVTISSVTGYAPEGVVESHQLSSSAGTGTGIGVAQVPPSRLVGGPALVALVIHDDTVIYEGPIFGSWTGPDTSHEPTDDMLAAAVRHTRGLVIDRAILARFVGSALQDSRLSARDVTIRVRWCGRINDKPAALFTIQPRDGGVIAYAMHGDTTGWRTGLRLLLPADGVDQRPIAWRMRVEGRETRTDRVIVVAPPDAATVTVTTLGGTPTPVTLDASGFGATTVPPTRPATVTAHTADGTTLASTPIPAFETNTGGLPGTTPNTRITG
ncbi:hypothetical protein Vqi01_43160 [Micromonospora qiuiae]|uniref:Uncharacterized protein n=1 Tax=Micromonospora qiuiae TaxID=502268 RepID=A0ABQ4JI04_9ACTN|nr:hypothetical protein [Micromonospora qiuiae]GIJ29154.1 hypothetical protein Vqi01_43160 [Micromonospora qiuiae]